MIRRQEEKSRKGVPPAGGYGAGLDPFCGDFVSCGIPASSSVSGINDYRRPGSHPRWEPRKKSIFDYLFRQVWVLSWTIPIAPVPVVGGVGPSGSVLYDPQGPTLCSSVGIGASGGRNVSIGPYTSVHTNPGYNTSDIWSGGSISGGINAPTGPVPFGPGLQGTINQAGSAGGPDLGVAGVSASSTTASCIGF